MEKIKNLLTGHSSSSEKQSTETRDDLGNSGSSAITGGSSQPATERRADPTTATSQSNIEGRDDLTTESGRYDTGSSTLGISDPGREYAGTNERATGLVGSSSNNFGSSEGGNGVLGPAGSNHATQSSQGGSVLSEGTSDQTGRNLLTGAGIVDTPREGVSRDPIVQSGAQHGSGRELGSSDAAGVTPGFSSNAHEGTQERSFPLSGGPATHSSNTTSGLSGRDATGTASILPSHNTSGQHAGRDATGTAAVIGEGLHHHHDNERGLGSNTTGLTGAHTSHTSGLVGSGTSGSGLLDTSRSYGTSGGPHKTMIANLLDPNIRGGVGQEDAVHHDKRRGGGSEEADAFHTPQLSSTKGELTRQDALQSTSDNVVGVDEFDPTIGGTTPGLTTESGTHHFGRDAAVVGGVGGAAYAAEHHHHNHDRNLNEAEHSGSSHLGRDVAVASGAGGQSYTRDLTGTEQNDSHHLGRDAAVAGGVGGAGYTAERHHHNHDKNLHETEHSGSSHLGRDVAAVAGPGGVTHTRDLTETEREAKREHKHDAPRTEHHHDSSHTTRHTALAAGTAGGAYVEDKRAHTQHDNADATDPSGKRDYGDHLHGDDRNRGVVGSSGFPDEPGFGDGTTHVKRDWRDTVRQAQADYGVSPDSTSLPTRNRTDYDENVPRSHNTTATGHSHSNLDANGTPRTERAAEAIAHNSGVSNAGGNTHGGNY